MTISEQRLAGQVRTESGLLGTASTGMCSGQYVHVLVQNLGSGNMYLGYPSGSEYFRLTVGQSIGIDTSVPLFGKCSGVGTTSFAIIKIT